MRVALIPARGGSQRIPKKNIKHFHGRPLISYSIHVAINSGLFDRVIVSTESLEVAKVAEQYGAEVPFLRPAELADDFTPLAAVTEHAIKWLEQNDCRPKYLCGIFATAPMICAEDLCKGYDVLVKAPTVRTSLAVTTFPFPVQRALEITSENLIEMMHPKYELTRSQDLKIAYHDAGQFFWKALGDVEVDSCRPVIIDRFRVQDIDTEEDWATAELQYTLVQGMRHDRRY